MKKALLLVLFAAVSMRSYTQNWVEIGIDVQLGTEWLPMDVLFVDDAVGYAIGVSIHGQFIDCDFSILVTQDGGATWSTLQHFDDVSILFTAIPMAKYKNNVHAVIGEGYYVQGQHKIDQLLFTENFTNPQLRDTFLTSRFFLPEASTNQMHPINDSIVLFAHVLGTPVEPNPYLYTYLSRFNKNNSRWEQDSIALPNAAEYVYDIAFVNDSIGFLAAGSHVFQHNGYLFATEDGGITWSLIKQAQNGPYTCVGFFDEQNGIMGGKEGMYYTYKNGFSIHPAAGLPSGFSAMDISITHDSMAYVIGVYHDGDFSYDDLTYKVHVYKSFDMGKNWCFVLEETVVANTYMKNIYNHLHISFANKNSGVAAFGNNRLIYTENGGGVTECVTAINNVEDGSALRIYPNPNQGSFTLQMPTKEAFIIEITDLSGKLIMRKQMQGNLLQIDGLESGMYIVSFQSQNHVSTQKVVVTH